MRDWDHCYLCKALDNNSYEFINVCQDCGEAYCDDCFHTSQHDLCGLGPPYIQAKYLHPPEIARANGAKAKLAGKPRSAPDSKHYDPIKWKLAWEAGWDGEVKCENS